MCKLIKKFRCGLVVLNVWEHDKVLEGVMVKYLSFTIDKAYKDGDIWKYTKNLSVEDLPKIGKLTDDAYRDSRVTVEVRTEQPGEEYENANMADEDGDHPDA